MTSKSVEENIHQLLLSLEKLSPRLEGRKEDVTFLKGMLQSNEFHSLMKVHKEVSGATASSEVPISRNALTLAHTISYDLESCPAPEAQELFDLLTLPHIDSLISTHDRIANKEYPVQSVAMETGGGTQASDQTAMIVRIEKKNDPLGATVKGNRDGTIVISRVLCGGAADKSNMLHSGDIIHEINGKSIRGYTIDDVADLMKGLTGTVVFKITPAVSEFRPKRRNQSPVYLRTYFSYDPEEDHHTPCPEAGLKFERGNILHVVNQDDPNWWQAVKDGDKTKWAGIVPSKSFRERMECYEMYGKQQHKKRGKTKKMMYSSFDGEMYGKEVVTYEEMVKIAPQVDRPRPLMLISPRGQPFDMDALRLRLIKENSERFGAPIPHTSRSPHADEENGKDFFFVRRNQMERDIQNNQFVEHGFLNGNYYGTSVNSIRSVTNSGKTCVLTLIPQAMKLVRTPELKPFIVYFRPPTADFMRQQWIPKKMIRESSIADIFRQAAYLDRTYSHYFDHTLRFVDMETAYTELLRLSNRLLQDQQWVPVTWARKQ